MTPDRIAIGVLIVAAVACLVFLGRIIFKKQNDDGWSDYQW